MHHSSNYVPNGKRSGPRSGLHAWLLFVLLGTACVQATEPASGDASALSEQQQAEQRKQAIHWLERMALAVEQLNYRGTFVYQQGASVRLLRIEHQRDYRGVRERLYSFENEQLEILRDNNLVQTTSPATDNPPILNYSQFTRLPASHLLTASSNYRFSVGGLDNIAGNQARQIQILPQDNLRYGFEYWLEIRTGMLLKQLLLNRQGEVLEKLVFTDIDIGDDHRGEVVAGPTLPAGNRNASKRMRLQPESDINPLTGQRMAEAGWSEAEAANDPLTASGSESAAATASNRRRGLAWQCVNPPRGYSLVAHQQNLQEDGHMLDHLLYSDGLSQISVYIEQHDGADTDTELPASRVGVMNIYRRMVDNVSITALGAAPYRSLRMLGGSMVRLTTAAQLDDGEQKRSEKDMPAG